MNGTADHLSNSGKRGCRKPRAITCGSPKATTFPLPVFWNGASGFSGGGNVVYLAEPLNYYRVHDSNTTAESIATGRKHIETLRILEETFRLIDPPLICRLSIAGKHLLRIRKAAGSHWNEEPYLSVRLAWRERYRHPRMIMFWHKVFKDLPRSFAR